MITTTFSPCRKWRYTLTRLVPVTFTFAERNIDEPRRMIQFIGLNPSTADEVVNDNTIRRCINFASEWGFTCMVMTNLFAWRDTDPAKMKRAAEPIGADNDYWIKTVAQEADMVVACWGNHGKHLERGPRVIGMFAGDESLQKKLHHLGLTDQGHPNHPLYLPKKLQPIKL